MMNSPDICQGSGDYNGAEKVYNAYVNTYIFSRIHVLCFQVIICQEGAGYS